MYGASVNIDPWCPHCGYNETEIKTQEVVQETIIVPKTEEVLLEEDKKTANRCGENNGWWNPITEECMGKGNGFEVEI